MSDKTLILTVGLPRSGKSTWARAQEHPIVNPDSIRRALHGEAFVKSSEPYVWAIAHTMVDALFLAGHDTVILDACNNTIRYRDEWDDASWVREFVIIVATKEDCIKRAGDDEALVRVIERMALKHQGVRDAEGKSYRANITLMRQEGVEPSPN